MYKVTALAIAAIAMATASNSNLFAQQQQQKKDPPPLPLLDGTVDISAQPSHFHGNKERTVRLYITYPRSRVANVTKTTGLLLSLHNWGGTYNAGTRAIARCL